MCQGHNMFNQSRHFQASRIEPQKVWILQLSSSSKINWITLSILEMCAGTVGNIAHCRSLHYSTSCVKHSRKIAHIRRKNTRLVLVFGSLEVHMCFARETKLDLAGPTAILIYRLEVWLGFTSCKQLVLPAEHILLHILPSLSFWSILIFTFDTSKEVCVLIQIVFTRKRGRKADVQDESKVTDSKHQDIQCETIWPKKQNTKHLCTIQV